jgi:transposase
MSRGKKASKFLVATPEQIEALRKARKNSKNPFTVQRAKALLESIKGTPIQEIKAKLGMSYNHVNTVIIAFQERGMGALKPVKRGRKPAPAVEAEAAAE